MKLEDQVCSLEYAKKLKELGVPQESLYIWVDEFPIFNAKIRLASIDEFKNRLAATPISEEAKALVKTYAAFTVAELGEMLPPTPIIDEKPYYLTCCKYAKWHVKYVHYDNGIGYLLGGHPEINGDTEADARAAMLIYLLENGLITIEK